MVHAYRHFGDILRHKLQYHSVCDSNVAARLVRPRLGYRTPDIVILQGGLVQEGKTGEGAGPIEFEYRGGDRYAMVVFDFRCLTSLGRLACPPNRSRLLRGRCVVKYEGRIVKIGIPRILACVAALLLNMSLGAHV